MTIGAFLGPYEITALLGKGGMGEVYRARDTKLKRNVAIKILPAEFSRDGLLPKKAVSFMHLGPGMNFLSLIALSSSDVRFSHRTNACVSRIAKNHAAIGV